MCDVGERQCNKPFFCEMYNDPLSDPLNEKTSMRGRERVRTTRKAHLSTSCLIPPLHAVLKSYPGERSRDYEDLGRVIKMARKRKIKKRQTIHIFL